MKLNRIISIAAVLVLGSMLLGCQRETPIGEARAVAAGEEVLTFAAVQAPAQELPVYADGNWAVDVDADWITVEPMSGRGMGKVTVSVADNLKGSVQDKPRQGTITIQGGNTERRGIVVVKQGGDTYFGVKEFTLSQLYELQDGDVAKVASAQVTGLSKSGAILTDNTGSIYATGTEGLALGDKISFNGKKTTVNGIGAFVMDEHSVTAAAAEITYPTAKDITSDIASYKPGKTEYVQINGSLVGTNIRVTSAIEVPILDPLESLKLDALDLHKAVFTGYGVGTALLVTAVEDGGADESLVPYPLKFKVRTEDINYSTATFSATSRIQPVLGLGYIEYVPFDLAGTDSNHKYALDVSDKSPRCTGPWPGDYWLFYGNGAIKAGSEVRIAFEARTSATGHKFWILEFLDGEEWRPACDTQVSSEPGEEVVYTHAMHADGSTNVQADYIVKYRKNNPHAQFRFRCVANWQASGAGKLGARNGGSARLTVTDIQDPTFQPTIEIVKEGNGVERDPIYADIAVSTDLLTFNGTPTGPKKITVSSDYAFTLSSNADWLSFDPSNCEAGEHEISVTCAPSELSELREAKIKIVSEDSEKSINVVQSAAGQMLDPFVSVSSGNRIHAESDASTITVRIQTNVETLQTEVSEAWLSVAEAPSTKALVEWKDYLVTLEENTVEKERTGTVRFYNDEANIETVVTLTQAGVPNVKVYFKDNFEWLAPYTAAYKETKPTAVLDPVGSNVSSHDQPNIWNDQTNFKVVTDKLYELGYEDLNPTAKTLYMQENYFKMGANNKQTGLKLPANAFEGDTPVNVELSFDWCAHMGSSGAIDNVTITVELSGPGICADSESNKSNAIVTAQEAGKLEWQKAKVILVGVTQDTRISIRPTNMGSTPAYQRWHLDNILITETDYSFTPSATFPVVWSFPEPGDNWKAGVDFYVANPSGSYVYSDNHEGKLTVVRFGDAPSKNPTYSKEGDLGVRLLHYGIYKDDYWLFEVNGVKNPAGTYTIGYGAQSSAKSAKFFALEYSVDEGSTWTGINLQTKNEAWTDETNGREVTYTYAMPETANEVKTVTESFKLPALDKVKLMIRARVADTMGADRTAEISGPAHGGTNRIGGRAEIRFTADE